jgi:CDP-diacylglycerol--glycerol-3-phosphate 3-phosphatidyltransferase
VLDGRAAAAETTSLARREDRSSTRFPMTYTKAIGVGCKWVLDRIVRTLALAEINPNVLTFLGLVINTAAAILFGYGRFLAAGFVIIAAGIFDLVDGRVARYTNTVSDFGAFFDSVVDRYSDLALFFGLLVYYARINRFFYIVLVAIVMTGSVMVSYTRARAENVIPNCKVGFMERPERIVLVIIGALFNRMAAVLWVIAILSNITVVHRIIYTYRQTRLASAQVSAARRALVGGEVVRR